jgi:hypothetical protein
MEPEEPGGADHGLCGGAPGLEVAGLRVADVDSAPGVILARHGKGGKDRNVLLTPQLANFWPGATADWVRFAKIGLCTSRPCMYKSNIVTLLFIAH